MRPLVAIATQHGKEALLGPQLTKAGFSWEHARVDTDQFGMFTGEVPRTLTPVQACIAKARLGAATLQSRYGLANEGSFGPHPSYPWLTVDDELVALWDAQEEYAVLGRARSFHHMFRVRDDITTPEAFTAFLAEVGFPEQGVLVRLADGSVHGKDVAVLDDLLPIFWRAYREQGVCTLETDVRAHRNPLRRQVITQAGEDCLARWGRVCPVCTLPGWGPERPVSGAPCADCGTPTEAPCADDWSCPACQHQEFAVPRPLCAPVDAGQCPRCNP